jgi:hypothetical protein
MGSAAMALSSVSVVFSSLCLKLYRQSALILLHNKPDPVAYPGSGAFLTPGSGMGKKIKSGSGMNIPDHYFRELRNYFLG